MLLGEMASPPSAGSGSKAGNLPVALTRLVGRSGALLELRHTLETTRLLTLCGPGGAGKTRLAHALAEQLQADLPGGAWWVDLSNTFDDALVAPAASAGVWSTSHGTDALPAAITERFCGPALLVLDNCEQVVDGSAELAAMLLSSCPDLRILATSRRSLGVPGEHVWRTEGLEVTDGEDAGAVALFVERAFAAGGRFDLERPGVRDTVRRICRQVDGIPLAIELAAARVAVLSPDQIAERLVAGSGILSRTGASIPARHRTLHATLDWSLRLLEPAEQALFRRLGCFRSFSLEAAEQVCGDLPGDRELLDLLGSLIDGSLVRIVEDEVAPRYELLAVVRQYALELLEQSGEEAAIRARHADYFSALAEAHDGRVAWLARMEVNHGNLNEALSWLCACDVERAARLASGLWAFWYPRGYYHEARIWFERVLARSGEVPAATRVDVLNWAGQAAFLQCEYSVARHLLEDAVALARELSDGGAEATALQRLGSIAREQARYKEAVSFHRRSEAIWRALGDSLGVARSQSLIGFASWLAGEPALAEEPCAAAVAVFRAAGELPSAAEALVHLGTAASYRGEPALAEQRLREALALSRQLGFQEGIAWSLHELAVALRKQRRPVHELSPLLREALVLHRRLGDRWRLASVLEEIASGIARENLERSLVLLAAADALRERIGAPVPPAESPERELALRRLKGRLRAGDFQARWAAGRALSLEEAAELALESIDGADGSAGPRDLTIEGLTPRERAVLTLLARGQTNREIAAALYISPSTAGVHVSNILHKLGAKRRVDAAAVAEKLGLLDGAAPA